MTQTVNSPERKPLSVICLSPVFNDWESYGELIARIREQFDHSDINLRFIAVDDCSPNPMGLSPGQPDVTVVRLKVNVGHQRAIAIGLQFIHARQQEFDYVIVLDSDGEDRPEDIRSMISAAESQDRPKIIFARRRKRQESWIFKTGYFFYKQIFYALTGQQINFGNFSCIPAPLLYRVVAQDNLWNHYSGSIIQSRIPYSSILLDRGKRYHGVSKMKFTNLVLHGLSSIAVYFDSLSVRILKLSLVGFAFCIVSACVVLYMRLFAHTAIPGWASSLLFIIFSIILQLSSVTLIVLLMQLSSRKNVKAPDEGIYQKFIANVETV